MKDYLTLRAGFGGFDAMRDKAQRAFGDLVNPKRAAIQETASAMDATPVRKFAKGGNVKREPEVTNELRHKKDMSPGIRQSGKLYKEGGKADKKIDNYEAKGLYGRKRGGKVK